MVLTIRPLHSDMAYWRPATAGYWGSGLLIFTPSNDWFMSFAYWCGTLNILTRTSAVKLNSFLASCLLVSSVNSLWLTRDGRDAMKMLVETIEQFARNRLIQLIQTIKISHSRSSQVKFLCIFHAIRVFESKQRWLASHKPLIVWHQKCIQRPACLV